MKKIIYLLIILIFLSACTPAEEFQGRKNPKIAEVLIENEVVSIKIPRSTPYFWLQKVKDDSVPYQELFFKYDPEEGKFFFQTNLDDWQPVAADENKIEMGQVLVAFEEREITITYPSGK